MICSLPKASPWPRYCRAAWAHRSALRVPHVGAWLCRRHGGRIGHFLGGRCLRGSGRAGLSAFATVLAHVDMPLRVGGGAFMLWLGWRSLRASTQAATRTHDGATPARTTASTFCLTMTNPTTILSFAALLAGLGWPARRPARSRSRWWLEFFWAQCSAG